MFVTMLTLTSFASMDRPMGLGSKQNHVSHIHARPVVAEVVDLETIGNAAVLLLPRNPMS
jgi:hypothetical protein